MTFIPSTVELRRTWPTTETVEVPVVVTDVDASEAPVFGNIARRAGLTGRDTEPLWTVVATTKDGRTFSTCRDQLSRFNAFAARGFASDLFFNGYTVERFEVRRYV